MSCIAYRDAGTGDRHKFIGPIPQFRDQVIDQQVNATTNVAFYGTSRNACRIVVGNGMCSCWQSQVLVVWT